MFLVMLKFSLFIILSLHSPVLSVISLDNVAGNDTVDCLQGSSSCRTLDYVFQNSFYLKTRATIFLYPGTHLLTKVATLTAVDSFKMISNGSVIECRGSNTGFAFNLSTDITLHGIAVRKCAFSDAIGVRSAFHFKECANVYINNTKFVENVGVALFFSEDKRSSSVIIRNSVFVSNHYDKDLSPAEVVFSGGIYAVFATGSERVTYELSNNTFANHSASGNGKTHFAKESAVKMEFHGGAQMNTIKVKGCEFSNNKALWGGGIFAQFTDVSQRNEIEIHESVFYENSAAYAGGAVHIESLYSNDTDDVSRKVNAGNVFNFYGCKFIRNSAIMGGGISVNATTRLLYTLDDSTRDVNLTECIFKENMATVGFALGLMTLNRNKDVVGPGMSYRVMVNECFFERNKMVLTEDEKVIGQGAIYSEEVTLVFSNKNSFIANTQTAVTLDSSSLTLTRSSETVFANNRGFEGGAISLYGSSWIILQESSRVLFENNSATRNGGALFVGLRGPPRVAFATTLLQTQSCFLRFEDRTVHPSDWPVTIIFRNNSAPVGSGNSVYSSTLQSCRMAGEKRVNSRALRWRFIRYEKNMNNHSEVVTNPIEIGMDPSQWNVPPSFPFSPDLLLTDERNQSVYGSVRVNINSPNQNVRLDPPNNVFLVRGYVAGLKLVGKTVSNFSVSVSTNTGQYVSSPVFDSSLSACSPGFRYDPAERKCVCMDSETGDVLQCLENGTVYIMNGKWSYVNEGTSLLSTVVCPKRYCECHVLVEDFFCTLNLTNQCAGERMGRLCSQCPEGLSNVIGNEDCKECSNWWLFLFVPGVLVLILVTFLVLHFDVDAFSGYLNAYFYCYQVVFLLIPNNINVDPFIAFVISVSSFSGTGGTFGVCLFNGLDNLVKIAFNYFFPFTFLAFALIFGLLVRESIWKRFICGRSGSGEETLQRRARSSGRAISFALVVGFSQMIKVTIQLLRPIEINGKWYVYEAAFAGYFRHPVHIAFGIIAIIVAILVVLFLLALVFTTEFKDRCGCLVKLDPVFESLKYCFCDGSNTPGGQTTRSARLFAAYYFVCRIIMLFLGAAIQEEVQRLIVLAIFCVIFLTIMATCQPYKESTFNYWDISILFILTIISLLSLILSIPFITSNEVRNSIKVLTSILVYWPLASVIIRFVNFLYIRCRSGNDNSSVDGIHIPGRVYNASADQRFHQISTA